MNKPITPNKFATDIWSMVQMLIEEAVLAEREACAKHLDDQNTGMTDMLAAEIRARGNT